MREEVCSLLLFHARSCYRFDFRPLQWRQFLERLLFFCKALLLWLNTLWVLHKKNQLKSVYCIYSTRCVLNVCNVIIRNPKHDSLPSCRVALASTSQKETVLRESSPSLGPQMPSSKPSLWSHTSLKRCCSQNACLQTWAHTKTILWQNQQ